MIINGESNAEIRAQFSRRMNLMARLEVALRPDLFRRLVRMWRSVTRGGVLEAVAVEQQDELRQILENAGQNTARVMTESLERDIERAGGDGNIRDEVVNGLLVAIAFRARESARIIVTTETNDIHTFIRRLADAGSTRAQIMEQVAARGPVAARTRAALIAQVETARASDDALKESIRRSGLTFRTKTWLTAGDEAVRDSHAAADNQTVPFGDPFVVDGERLLQPRDDSLGASAGNIIRCRCVANFTFD